MSEWFVVGVREDTVSALCVSVSVCVCVCLSVYVYVSLRACVCVCVWREVTESFERMLFEFDSKKTRPCS